LPGPGLHVVVKEKPSADHLNQLIACLEASLLPEAESLDHQATGLAPLSKRVRRIMKYSKRMPVLTHHLPRNVNQEESCAPPR
jgi:hypothetical protein